MLLKLGFETTSKQEQQKSQHAILGPTNHQEKEFQE